jgi:hypothetical protein
MRIKWLSKREGALVQRRRRGGSQNSQGDDGYQGGRERYRDHDHEPYDDPDEHHRIESYRFAGGLPATPERYLLAREQWQRLPGAVVGPSMNPAVGASDTTKPPTPEQGRSGEEGPDQ